MKLQLKRSNVVGSGNAITASGLAKSPDPNHMLHGEIAVNFCNEDPTIFIKLKDNTVYEPYLKKDSIQHLQEIK